jgi:phosphotriesterase-related protein
MSIMTVRGPIAADDLGFTTMHEHLWCDLYRVDRHLAGILNDEPLITREIVAYRDAGGQSLVEVTSRGLGRNPAVLRSISEATGLNIVMGSGWYRQSHYPPEIESSTTNELAAIIEHDVAIGIDGVHAGIIGELGNDRSYISPAEERVFRAAARAHLRTGVAITTHAFGYPIGLAQLDVLEEEGADLRRVIVGHCDSYPHLDYYEALLARGAYVQFDLVGKVLTCTDAQRVSLITELLEKGYANRILLASDTCMRSSLHAHGGPGYDHLIRSFVPALRAAGVSQEQVQLLTVENPRVVLSV